MAKAYVLVALFVILKIFFYSINICTIFQNAFGIRQAAAVVLEQLS
jgi:Na+/alanine symporter